MTIRNVASRWMTLAALTAATSGCTYMSISPRDGEIVTGPQDPVPVTVRLEWPSNARGMGPFVEIDGVPVATAKLDYTSTGARTIVYLRPGLHTVRARSAQLCAICVGGVGLLEGGRTFLVALAEPPAPAAPAVSLTLTPTTVAQASGAK